MLGSSSTHAVAEQGDGFLRIRFLRHVDKLSDVSHQGVPAAFAEIAKSVRPRRSAMPAVVQRPDLVFGRVEDPRKPVVTEGMFSGAVADDDDSIRDHGRRPVVASEHEAIDVGRELESLVRHGEECTAAPGRVARSWSDSPMRIG